MHRIATKLDSELRAKFNMCFSGEMSAFFSLSCIICSGIVYRAGRLARVSVTILYFGLMELLQTVQYLVVARPEDGYSMCKNSTNQVLTAVGFIHICFQPVFINMALSAMERRNCLQTRYENDIIQRLCIVGALWFASRYLLAVYWHPNLAATPSEDCPNYEWVRDGFDAGHSRYGNP